MSKEVLNKKLVGNIDEQVKSPLKSSQLKFHPESVQDDATHNYFASRDVEKMNATKSNELVAKLYHFNASMRSSTNFKHKSTPHGTIGNTNFLENLSLKKGSRVMIFTMSTFQMD